MHSKFNKNLIIILLLGFLFSIINTYGGSTIDKSSLTPVPTSGLFHLFAGGKPDNDAIVSVNPPTFKWLYKEDGYSIGYPTADIRSFIFEGTTNGSFISPLWSIATSNNFFSSIHSITNLDGSSFLGRISWRVRYYDSNSLVVGTSAVYNFTISPTATMWDRARYADSSFLISAGVHPHMLFNSNNIAAMTIFLHTNVNIGFAWSTMTNNASSAVHSTWWNDDSMTNQNPANLSQSICDVCLNYQIDSNAFWKSKNPGQMVSRLASSYITFNYDQADQNIFAEASKYLPLCYDWAYSDMTIDQRSNVLWTLEQFSKFFINSDWFYTMTPDPTRTWGLPLQLQYYSSAEMSADHNHVDSGTGLYMAMAGMGESAILRDHFSYYFNYSISQQEPFHNDEGRGYAEQSFRPMHCFSSIMLLSCFDQGTTNIEWLHVYPKMLAYLEPLNYCEEESQYGDFGLAPVPGIYPPLASTGLYLYKYWDVSLLTGDGSILRQYNRANTIRPGGYDMFYEFGEAFMPYYYPNLPTETDWPTNYYVNTEDGWIISHQFPPNTWDCFTNGVSWILTGRPGGECGGHDQFHDGALEITAYGAQVSFGGYGQYYKHAMANNGLFVDGIGNCTPNGQLPWSDIYSHIIGFTNNTDFTYGAVDLSQAFNNWNTNNSAGGNLGNIEGYYNESTNRRPYVVCVQRHVLSPHHKYQIIYDQFKTTTNANFQWKWNILESTETVDTNAMTFDYYSTNFFGGESAGLTNVSDASTTITTMFPPPNQLKILTGQYTAICTNTLNTNNITSITTTLGTLFNTVYFVSPFYWTNIDLSIKTNWQVTVSYEARAPTLDTNIIIVGQTANMKTNVVNRFVSVHTFISHIVDSNLLSMIYITGTNSTHTNPFTMEDLTPLMPNLGEDRPEPQANSVIWVYNKTKTTNWHDMSVIFPVKWGHPDPTITRIDDKSVEVNDNEGTDDVITFDANFIGSFTFKITLTDPNDIFNPSLEKISIKGNTIIFNGNVLLR